MKVLDVKELIKPRYEAHKMKQVELAKQEAIEAAIANVNATLKEQEDSKSLSLHSSRRIRLFLLTEIENPGRN